MEKTPQRGMTLRDALILVAAAGGGFAFAREFLDRYGQLNGSSFNGYEVVVHTTCCAAFSISIALIPLRFRRPRPRWHSLRWQPGLVACFAVIVSLICSTFTHLPTIIKTHGFGITLLLQSVVWPPNVGPIIIGMWSLQALGNRWRSEASWIDREGRTLGFFWIASYAFVTVAPLLE